MQRRAWGIVALGTIGAVGAWLYFRHHTEQRARAAIAEAATAFTQCIVGEDWRGQDVGTALERRRLALSGAPRAWVLDCAGRADELVAVLVDAGAADGGSRWYPLLERARAVADGVVEHDDYLVLSEGLVGPLLEALASSDLPGVAASERVSSAPAARLALVELDLTQTLPPTGYPVRTDPVPSRMIRLLLEHEWCEYDPRDPSNGLRCHPRPCQLCADAFFASAPDVPGFAGVVDPSSPGKASDVGTLFVTDGPERTLELETGQITSAHVEPGGAMVAMGRPGIRFRADGFEHQVVRTRGDARWWSWVLWDALVEGDMTPGSWTVRTVPAEGEPETPRLPMSSGRRIHPRACRDENGLAVATQVVEPAGGASDVTLRFRRSGEWSPAMEGRVRWTGFGFSELPYVAAAYLPMVCADGAATFTGFADGVVEQLTCTPEDACSVARSETVAEEPPTWETAVRAVPLGERVLLVRLAQYWGGLGALTSTIRYRLAPVEDLAAAEERVLAGTTHGPSPLRFGSRIEAFSRGSEALVVFGDPALAVRFDSDGTVRQVPVER